jgi:hypothetical protein
MWRQRQTPPRSVQYGFSFGEPAFFKVAADTLEVCNSFVGRLKELGA